MRVIINLLLVAAAPPGIRFGGNILGGPGAEPPGRQKILKISKKFLKKIAKMGYFRRFFKKIKNPALNFRALDKKHKCMGIFEKIFKDVFRK